LQPPDNDQYHIQLPLKMVHRVYSNATSYQHVINMIVSLPIRRSTIILTKISVWDQRALKHQIFYVANFIVLTPLPLFS